ncbi:pyridoxal phosphate-dependent aminotransferase [Desulfonema magnum]|uniref:Aminotransferase n=1 Tax=Desulfonema magnum TaxID=45655 RepID=A0A975BK07_9BACT|nr:pyridoxal phosphate-dependent aminotransferase [Desulfonema magnum]QTA87094.1 Aminotransferase family protein, class I and II [Desulfonema magnum]
MKLSDRIQSVEESGTVKFSSLLQKLRKQGKEIISFAIGEPEYETPGIVIESTKNALDRHKTRYGPAEGMPELRQELAKTYEGYDADNIIVSNGSKHSLYLIFQVICDPCDEVIIPRPCWTSFPQQVRLAGGKPVFADTNKSHQLDCEEIEKAITPKTKAILINTPNNPTGAVYPKTDLEKIARISSEHDLYIISDEAYDFFIYDGLKNESIFEFREIRDRVIITKSFSKSYNMTGFRVGYVAAHKNIVKAMSKCQGHCTGNVCTFAQYGALAALSLDGDVISQWQAELEKKRDIAYGYASKLFHCIRPQGAFYLFPDISNYLKNGETSEDFAADLLEKTGVAVVPGEAFGMAGHVRICYAVPENMLRKGFEKIAEAL